MPPAAAEKPTSSFSPGWSRFYVRCAYRERPIDAPSRPARGFRGRKAEFGLFAQCFLAAIRQVREGCPRVGRHVLGDGDEKAVVPQLCAALGLVERVGRRECR